MTSVSTDDVSYAFSQVGAGEPLVLLHGFTGSKDAWWLVRDQLAAHAQVTSFDLLGHGESSAPSDASHYAFETVLDSVAEAAVRIGISRATWLGYSLGGRLALGLALRHPALVSALVLESASPGLAEARARNERVRVDDALAQRIERDGVAKFVTEWESLPLWQSQSSLPLNVRERQRSIRLQNRAMGLANALRGMGQGAQPSHWTRLIELQVPVLLLSGELDVKYAEIAQSMATKLPDARVEIVPGVGHAVHLEAPDDFVSCVISFMAENEKLADRRNLETAQ